MHAIIQSPKTRTVRGRHGQAQIWTTGQGNGIQTKQVPQVVFSLDEKRTIMIHFCFTTKSGPCPAALLQTQGNLIL